MPLPRTVVADAERFLLMAWKQEAMKKRMKRRRIDLDSLRRMASAATKHVAVVVDMALDKTCCSVLANPMVVLVPTSLWEVRGT